jgi:hypothetical protein
VNEANEAVETLRSAAKVDLKAGEEGKMSIESSRWLRVLRGWVSYKIFQDIVSNKCHTLNGKWVPRRSRYKDDEVCPVPRCDAIEFTASKFHDPKEYSYCKRFGIKGLFDCYHVVVEIWYSKIYNAIEEEYYNTKDKVIPALKMEMDKVVSRNEEKALQYMGFKNGSDISLLNEGWNRIYKWIRKIPIYNKILMTTKNLRIIKKTMRKKHRAKECIPIAEKWIQVKIEEWRNKWIRIEMNRDIFERAVEIHKKKQNDLYSMYLKTVKDKNKLEWRYYMKGQSNFDRISKKWEISGR